MKKKSTWLILGGGLLIGIVMVFLRKWLNLTDTTIYLLLILLWFVLVGGFLFYRMKLSNKVNQEASAIFPLLFEQGNPDAYIEKMDAFLQKQKEPYFVELCRINLSLGYSCKGDHEKALEYLYAIDQKRIKSTHLIILYINIIMENFFLGDYTAAKECLHRYRQALRRYEENPNIGQNIKSLYRMEEYVDAVPEESALRRYLEEKKGNFENLQIFNSYCYFIALDQQRRKNQQGVKTCLEEIRQNEPVMEIQIRLRTIEKEAAASEV